MSLDNGRPADVAARVARFLASEGYRTMVHCFAAQVRRTACSWVLFK